MACWLVSAATGIERKSLVFLFTDTQIVDEGMVEDINNILNSGEVPSLFTPEERDKKINQSTEKAREAGQGASRDEVYAYFISTVRDRMHIVLAMSPIGDAFRTRSLKTDSWAMTVQQAGK
eukprot:gene56649-biopygen37864